MSSIKTTDWTFPRGREQWYPGEGPWDSEPDKRQWEDEATGMACLIVRNGMGALCGYVGVPSDHPWYGKDDVEQADGSWVDVHGGLTFSGPCQAGGKVCHIVEPGGDDDVWWQGFDCAHSMDLTPSSLKHNWYGLGDMGGTYRDIAYVTAQVEGLARQAAVMLPAG